MFITSTSERQSSKRDLQNLTIFLKRTLGFLDRRPATFPFNWDMIPLHSSVIVVFKLISSFLRYFLFKTILSLLSAKILFRETASTSTVVKDELTAANHLFLFLLLHLHIQEFRITSVQPFLSFLMASASSSCSRRHRRRRRCRRRRRRPLPGEAEISSNRDSLVSATTVKLHVVRAIHEKVNSNAWVGWCVHGTCGVSALLLK